MNRIIDKSLPVDAIVTDPVEIAKQTKGARHPHIPQPRDLFDGSRLSAQGMDISDPLVQQQLAAGMQAAGDLEYNPEPLVAAGFSDIDTLEKGHSA